MHISEGVLSPAVLTGGAVLAAAGVWAGLRRVDYDRLMQVAILSAVFFVGSLVHVPVGLGSAHLILNGLLGVLLGWAVFPALLVALLLQALLFQFGGLTVLGVNVATMGAGGILAHYICRCCCRLPHYGPLLGGFLAGAAGVLAAGVLTAAALALSGEAFQTAARLVLLAHLPIMLAEGCLTLFTVNFLVRVRPGILPFACPARRLS